MNLSRFRRALFLVATLSLALLFAPPAAPQPLSAEPVSYELHFDRPNSHLLDITVRASGLGGPSVEFALPAWAPGWYIINDYAKMVQEFSATSADGRPLAWRKTFKQTWRIDLAGASAVALHYKLFGNTLAVDWVQYNDRHAHISGPATWMYLVGGKDRPARLTIAVPAGWRVATGMERTGENAFRAADYDTFADSPIEISDFVEKSFTVAGTTYHVVVHDVLSKKDFTQFAGNLQRAVESLVAVFAPVVGGPRPAPFADYWFLFHVWPGTGGGLEHLNSTQIFFSSDWDAALGSGRGLSPLEARISTSAHEFFHAWNVKRMRPKPLGPFDYSREVSTPSLWISEGLTSYYGMLALVRAGLIKPEVYLTLLGQMITGFERSPGREERSIEDASWDTWFWYRSAGPADTNISNTNIDYYTGGQIAGHLLDLAIRQATNNRKSLDDWMRLLYQRYALPKPGFEPEDPVRAASEVTGKDMSDFFRRYISSKEIFPYEEYFAYAGIKVQKQLAPERAWLGIFTQRNDDGRARITNVIRHSPAEAADLDRGDIILAVDGRAVTAEEFQSSIAAHRPSESLKITVIHSGELKERRVTLVADPYPAYIFTPMENPSEQQKQIYRSWLNLK